MTDKLGNLHELQKIYGVGLTGGIATGKSTVADILRRYGYVVITADLLSRKAVEPGSRGLAKVVSSFGGIVLKENGTLDRSLMRNLVFADTDKLRRLESIIHPIVNNLLVTELENYHLFERPKLWFYESSILYETNLAGLYRLVWSTYCSRSVQLKRLQARDKNTLDEAKRLVESQMDTKVKAKKADLVLATNASIEELETRVKAAIATLPIIS